MSIREQTNFTIRMRVNNRLETIKKFILKINHKLIYIIFDFDKRNYIAIMASIINFVIFILFVCLLRV